MSSLEGSNPSLSAEPEPIVKALSGGMAERTKAIVLKTIEPVTGSEGSNPSPSACNPRKNCYLIEQR